MNYFTRIFKAIFVVVSIFLGTVSISAADFVVDGIYYNILSAEDKTCAVTFAGAAYDEIQDEYVGDISIPSNVLYNGNEYTITTISKKAFTNCKNLTSILIPNSITSIQNGAFNNCTSLKSITFPESITIIDNSICMSCSALEYITILGQVSQIKDYAFNKCNELKEIKLYSITPPTINLKTNNISTSVTIIVPNESEESYKEDSTWGQFNIKTDKLTIIDTTFIDNTEIVEYYNILGVKVENPTKGLYIKKCGGKAYKVML